MKSKSIENKVIVEFLSGISAKTNKYSTLVMVKDEEKTILFPLDLLLQKYGEFKLTEDGKIKR
jgi:hypothetical protein